MIGAPLEFTECFSSSHSLSASDLSPTSAEMHAEAAAMKALMAWSLVTSPSMTGSLPGQDQARPGLIWYRYDQGYFADEPTWFKSLQPSAGDKTQGWTDLNQVGPKDGTPGTLPIAKTVLFSMLIKGYFVPKMTGIHHFTLSSDDASYLWWGANAAVSTPNKKTSSASIALPGVHALVTGSVSLIMTAGTAYPLSIMYGQGSGNWHLQFSFVPPATSVSSSDGTGYYYAIVAPGTVVAGDVVTTQ